MKSRILKVLFLVSNISLLHACSVNQVTGEYDLDLVSESQEISIGREHYKVQRQLQKGDYIVDQDLTDYIRGIGKKLINVSDRQLPYEFFVVNSSDFNAWALPGGKIGINRGLLVHLECESELAAILAHEIVHAAAGHGANSKSKEIFLGAVSLVSSLAIKDTENLQIFQDVVSIGGGLMLMKYSRNHELEADYYGMKYMQQAGFDANGMVKVQETMKNLSHDENNNLLDIMLSTHPPSDDRITQAQEFLNELDRVHDVSDCKRYQKATQHLKKTAVAYDYYEKALAELKKDELSEASIMIEKAITIEPDESLFYGIRALVHEKNNRKNRALADLDKAINLNPDYWRHYLTRASIQKN